MIIIGVTGSFGTGKSFVSSVFASLGAKVIDADRVAGSVFKKGSVLNREIAAAFGSKMIRPDGTIDRKRLAGMVFSDKLSLRRLNRLVHPGIIKKIKDIVRRSGRGKIIVIDAPLLFETKLENFVDHIVVVKASLEKQVSRCGKKLCLKKADILKRVRSQMPLKKKIRRADFIVDNNGTKAAAEKQVMKIWGEISRTRRKGWK